MGLASWRLGGVQQSRWMTMACICLLAYKGARRLFVGSSARGVYALTTLRVLVHWRALGGAYELSNHDSFRFHCRLYMSYQRDGCARREVM